MKTIISIILFLLPISLVLAIYPGETTQVNLLDYTNPIYNITYLEDNNFTIDTNGTTAFITALNDSIPGSYYITFYLNGDAVEVYVASSSGSGGSHRSSSSSINEIIKNENWTCGEYGSCVDGISIRECKSESGRVVKDLRTCNSEISEVPSGEIKPIEVTPIETQENIIINIIKAILEWFRNLV